MVLICVQIPSVARFEWLSILLLRPPGLSYLRIGIQHFAVAGFVYDLLFCGFVDFQWGCIFFKGYKEHLIVSWHVGKVLFCLVLCLGLRGLIILNA